MGRSKYKSVYENLWAKIQQRGPSDCWEWTACKDKDGYGKFQYCGSPSMAHRVVWEFTRGKIPGGLNVCHHCDNPSCCNPNHLFLGTDRDNMRDKVNKHRLRNQFTDNPALTYEQKLTALAAYRTGLLSLGDIAEVLGVGKTTIARLMRKHKIIESPFNG